MNGFVCGKCNRVLQDDCTCSDRAERLQGLGDMSAVAVKWCVLCDQHYALCECGDHAEFMVKSGGKISAPGRLTELVEW